MSRDEFEITLRHLYLRSMNGDCVSYENFLSLSSVIIKRYLSKLGGKNVEQEVLEDLLQEILLTLHQKKHTFQMERPLLPWLYSIIRHRYIDYYRWKMRQPGTISIDAEFENKFKPDLESEPLFDMEDIMLLLTPKQKEMIFLIKIEGESYASAAKKMSMSVPAIKVGVHRIIKSLKEKVQ